MDNINKIFGEKIKSLRKEKNIKQEELANYLKISKANISKYETGKIEPSMQTINDIATFFNVTIDFLFSEEYINESIHIKSSIGTRIKNLRNENNISQQTLAKMLNLTQQAIGKWEKGITEPNIDAIIKLKNIFNVSLDYLILGTEDKVCITKKELELIKEYEKHTEFQSAINALLKIESKESLFTTSNNSRIDNINETIGLNVKTLRNKNKLTQEELAIKINTSKQNLSRYEKGQVQIPLEILFEISNIFHVSIDSLFYEG